MPTQCQQRAIAAWLTCMSHFHAATDPVVWDAGMQVDEAEKAEASTSEEAKPAGNKGDKEVAADGEKEAPASKPELSTHSLDNPARVVPAQEKLISFPQGSRFVPIRPGRTAGILLLKDSSPGKTKLCCAVIYCDSTVYSKSSRQGFRREL